IQLPDNNMFRFGFSLGAAWSKVDINALNFGTISPSDPIQVDLLDNNFQILSNAGASLHIKAFNIGISLPNIIQPVYLTTDAFTVSKINPFESAIIHTSYRFYFSNNFNVFEPYVVYRFNKSLPSQLEAAGILHLQHKVWIGGSYKQDFGISALGGFKLNNLLGVGYSYTLKNVGLNELNTPSHEIHIGLLFGERQKRKPYYSFVDTDIDKHPKNYKALVARQKQKEKAEARKHAAELAKKKADEEKAYREAIKVQPSKPEPTPEPTNPTQQPQHDAGARFKTTENPLNLFKKPIGINDPQEEEFLKRLEVHAENADELHGEDFHPNAERHEFVKKGVYSNEMDFGNYVIAGAFNSETIAKTYSEGLKKLEFESAYYGYVSERSIWYVYISKSNDINKSREDRDKYRKMHIFKDAWLLTVQE
ncbi:MAG TPA: type IX secretion system membrane protein PorP/SprF, partial [Cyclobacteriaceae bacterium]